MKVLNLTLGMMIGFISLTQAAQMMLEPMHLSLQQAMVLASKENAQVFVANERVRQALANISINRSGLLPQVTGIFGGRRQTTDLRASGINLPGDPHIGPYNSFDTRARLTMAIFDPSTIERLQSAKAGERLSAAEYQKVRGDILAMVASLFLEARRAAQAVELNQVNLTQAEHQLTLATVHLTQGTGSSLELDKAKMELAQAQYQCKAADVHAQQTRLDLASSLRISLDQPIIFDEDQAWVNQQLKMSSVSPDVIVSQAQLDVSQHALKEARAGFWPKLTAAADYGRLGESPSNSSNTYSVGLSVSLPIWEGGIKQAQLKKAQSQLREDEILSADVENQNKVKVKEARNNLDQAKALVTAKLKQLYYIEHQWTLTTEKLKSGLASQMEMDQADAIKALSVDEKNEAQALYWTAKINLAHAMGCVGELFNIK